MTYEPAIPMEIIGVYTWTGVEWLPVGDGRRSILFQPVPFLAAFGDPIAKCCRQDWIEQDHHLFPVAVHHQHVHSVPSSLDVEGHEVHALDHVFDVPRRGSFKQHVSFPPLEFLAGVGGCAAVPVAVRRVHEALLSFEGEA